MGVARSKSHHVTESDNNAKDTTAEEEKRMLEVNSNSPITGKDIAKDVVHQAELNKLAEPDRETWGKKVDFLLSVIGFAVDLANVWRFPYLCYKNGGGAFLIPYVLMLFLAGIPLFFMELALGQFNRKGAITCWGRICPLFKGIGYTVVLIAFYTDFYYNVIISWALYYFFASFTKKLPWSHCNNPWNTDSCYDANGLRGPMRTTHNGSAMANYSNIDVLLGNTTALPMEIPTTYAKRSPAEEYLHLSVMQLDESEGIGQLGKIRWELALCLLAVYIICYFSLWKGISTSGKVVWFTALFPYVVLFILLIRGVTLPGAAKGIMYYLKPDWEKMLNATVWVDAATQVFFSLGPGFGVLLAFSSYNKFHNNVYMDALVTSTINCLTSFLSGFVIFSVLGYMSENTGTPIDKVAAEGPGLVFIVYPEAIATLPGSTFWALIFFMMLLTLGLDSSFGGSEAIITALSDEFPWVKKNREIFVGLLFGFYFIVGLASCTQGGIYMVTLLDRYAAGYSILIAVFFETVAVSWLYGVDRFADDCKAMLGFNIGIYWKLCWKFIGPIFILMVMIFGFVSYEPAQYEDYEYPVWANVLGWLIACSSVLCIPFMAIYKLIITPGSFRQRMRILTTPWRDSQRTSITNSPQPNGQPMEDV